MKRTLAYKRIVMKNNNDEINGTEVSCTTRESQGHDVGRELTGENPVGEDGHSETK